VGWCALNPHSSRSAYAHVKDLSVYVSRGFRGRGLGKRLLTDLFAIGAENGVKKVVLTAFPFNADGMALYSRMGFRLVGTYRDHAYINGERFDVVIMERFIGSD
jgi:L-amino acid N-acyltransferase YncA